ncbi:MAG: UDP-3-O-acyl-N-acetylglucosamine deacetylase [Rhodospirillaceae bacterium]|nr:UDP-3-O-acyl-N-acetylglucosamine deacetylase [Rhodospirillaceae bacterium]
METGGTAPPRQRTLKNAIHCSGVSLHHGSRVSVTLHPAEPDTGIRFRRTDTAGAVIPATWRNVVESPLCTTLAGPDGTTIATVEHLLAALYGCGVDNLLVEVNGPELPIMDGSAWPFVFLTECAGLVEQDAPRRRLRILEPVTVSSGDRRVELVPAPAFTLEVEIAYDNCGAIARQRYTLDMQPSVFKAEVSRARTYGFLHEVDSLRAAGLARGASLDNAVVLSGETVLNEGGLRYRDEFVRHKVLDAVGDLSLAGAGILGRYRAYCPGHRLNHALLRRLFATPGAWRMLDPEEEAPAADDLPPPRVAAAG